MTDLGDHDAAISVFTLAGIRMPVRMRRFTCSSPVDAKTVRVFSSNDER
jgi:hypothetical protein